MEITTANRIQITHTGEPFKTMGFPFMVYDILGEYGPVAAIDWDEATKKRDTFRYRAQLALNASQCQYCNSLASAV